MGTLRYNILQTVHAFSQHASKSRASRKGRKKRRSPGCSKKLPLMYPANFSHHSHKVFLRQQHEWQQWMRSRRRRRKQLRVHKQQEATPGPIKLAAANASQPQHTEQQWQRQWLGPLQHPAAGLVAPLAAKRTQQQPPQQEEQEPQEPRIFKKPRQEGHQGAGKENVAPAPMQAASAASSHVAAKPKYGSRRTSQSAAKLSGCADLDRKRAVRNARLQRLREEWEAKNRAAGLMQQQGQQSASNSPGLLHLPIRSDEQQQQQQLTTAGSLERSGGLGGVCGDDDDEPLQQQQLTSTSSLEHSGGLGGVCGDVEEPQQQKQLEGAAEAHQQQLEGVETQQRQQQPQEGEHDTLQQLRQASPARQDSQEPEQQQQQQAAAGSPDGQSPAPKGLKPQHWARVSQLVQAVAAALGSTNKTGLQTALDQIKTWGEAIPVHRKGNLQYCSMCNEDLEDALLVYMMLKEDSSLEAITCRSCFMAALASWVDQQGGPRAVLANAAHLSNSKKLQLATWVGALCADDMGDGASSSSGSSSKGAQPYDSSFELPSSRHAALLQGRGFEEGKGWPLQYCSLRDGLSGLDLLLEVLERLPDDFTLPYYSELGQVRPSLVKAMPMPCAGGSNSRDKRSSGGGGNSAEALAVDAATLEALLKMLPPHTVTELVKPRSAASSSSTSSTTTNSKSPLTADAAVQQILGYVGVLQQHQHQQQRQGTRTGLAASAISRAADSLPYFNFNPIDRSNHMGLAAADAAITTQLSKMSSKVRPSSYSKLSTGVAKQETKKLLATAADAGAGGKAAEAGAYRFLATVLKIRSSSAMGESAVHDVLTQVLILLGGTGTFTRGHLDPAAALTYAYALRTSEKPFDPRAVLAEWLLISPLVFTQLPLLRKLLWTLRLQLLRRAAARCAEEAAAVQEVYGGPKLTRAQQAAAAAANQQAGDAMAAAQAALAELQQRLEQQRVLWGQQGQEVTLAAGAGAAAAAEPVSAAGPGASAVAAAADRLSAEEEGWLADLLTFSSLQPEEMREVQQELGEAYAVTLQQRAGRGVSVPVGWMHWVHNTAPCIKIAWEVLRPQEMAHAVLMHRRLRCRAHNLAADYLAVLQRALQELHAWRQFM